jgi:hypothetical protein
MKNPYCKTARQPAGGSIAMALCMLLLSIDAVAGPITFRFEGAVIRVDAALDSRFQIGQPISGLYSFDLDAPDTRLDDPRLGFFDYLDFEYRIGDYEGAAPIGRILVVDRGPPRDYFDIYRVQNLRFQGPVFGDIVNELAPIEASFQLSDETGLALANDGLPAAPPDPDDFEYAAGFRLTFLPTPIPEGEPPFQSVYGSIDAVTFHDGPSNPSPRAIPEPPTLWLMLFFALCLVLLGPRRLSG